MSTNANHFMARQSSAAINLGPFFPLRTAATIIEALREMITERGRVEIYFHPGVDPDAEAAVRLIYRWALRLGAKAEDISIFHLGEPRHLRSIEPILEAQPLSQAAIFDSERVNEVVSIVVDVSNMSYLVGDDEELRSTMAEPNFVFDHHHPRVANLRYDGDKVIGGTLVLPEMQASAMLIDRLVQMEMGRSHFLSERDKLAGLVVAAVLSDQGLETVDERPEWFSEDLWERVDEIREMADQTVIDELTVAPWKDEEYLRLEIEALEQGLTLREYSGVNVAFCWFGEVPIVQKKSVGHFADVLIQRRERVQRFLPDEIAFVVVLAAFDKPPHLFASVRSSLGFDARKIIGMLAKGGGGRETAAAAEMLRRYHPDAPESFVDWGKETLVTWGRRLEQLVRQTRKDEVDE